MLQLYPDQSDLNYATWLLFSLPALLASVLLCWGWLLLMFRGCCGGGQQEEGKVKKVLKAKYEELGPITFKEVMVGVCFMLLVFALFFQEPQFMPGWGDLFQVD